MVTEDVPKLLVEVISVTPAMWPNWRSRGVATEEAMISALAPGRLPLTEMVGKSTCGKGETGRTVNAMAPAIAIAMVSRVVATGRWMNGAETFMKAPQDRGADRNALPGAWARNGARAYRRRCR